MAERKLRTELQKMHKDPPPGISVELLESDIKEWKAILSGPENTPFEGGTFRLRLKFPPEYPNKPPVVWFYSKMFHPNVYKNGRICLDILEDEKKWSSDIDAANVLCGIQAMLGDPNPLSPANMEANQMFSEDTDLYESIVRAIVEKTYSSEDNEEENENLLDALQQEQLEFEMNMMTIQDMQLREGGIWK